MKTNYSTALRYLYPEIEVTVNANDYEQITIHTSGIELPSKGALDKAYKDYIKEHGHETKRRREYPPLVEQLDMLYHDKKNGTDTWLNAIEKVKNKFPKA